MSTTTYDNTKNNYFLDKPIYTKSETISLLINELARAHQENNELRACLESTETEWEYGPWKYGPWEKEIVYEFADDDEDEDDEDDEDEDDEDENDEWEWEYYDDEDVGDYDDLPHLVDVDEE